MRDACVSKGLVNSELCLHDGVIGRGEHGVYTVGNECLCGERDFFGGRCGALYIFNTFVVEVRLCVLDGGGGGILSYVVQKADLLGIGVLGEDEVHNRVGIEVIGGARHVAARLFKGSDKTRADRVGHGGEHDRRFAVFGCGLHRHGDRGRDTDHEIYVIGCKVCDDLIHDVRVGVTVVVLHVDCDALLAFNLGETCIDVLNDLV